MPPGTSSYPAINEELFQAVSRKDICQAASILKGGSHVNARSVNGHSVIYCAVMNNDLRMVRLLTTHGVVFVQT